LLYDLAGKKLSLPGNFMVSLCVAAPFIYGGLLVSSKLDPLLLLFALLAFLSVTGREVTKGIADVEGDRLKGSKTLAIIIGPEGAARVATLFYALAVLLSIAPWLLNLVSPLYLPFIAVAGTGLIASSISLLKDCSRESARGVKNQVLVWMSIGLIAFVLGGVKLA
jgi:geranylgeranylglycerol-phosphate geranylgeranyltransferase